jgi:hypothetical protein
MICNVQAETLMASSALEGNRLGEIGEGQVRDEGPDRAGHGCRRRKIEAQFESRIAREKGGSAASEP